MGFCILFKLRVGIEVCASIVIFLFIELGLNLH